MSLYATNDRSPLTIGADFHYIDWMQGSSGSKHIHLHEQSKGRYGCIGIWEGKQKREIECTTQAPGGEVSIVVLLIARPHSETELFVNADLLHDHTTVHIHLLSFLLDEGNAKIDGNIFIAPQTRGCAWRLLEENIILGEKTHLNTIPKLNIHTSQVSASHGATIQRLNRNHLFYLTAKGISLPIAQQMIIMGHLENLLQGNGVFSERELIIKQCLPYLHI